MTASKQLCFPAIELALDEPEGLLAIGGDLTVTRLVEAYSYGIFPWFQDDDPIMWWSPKLRAVIIPDRVHVSRTLKKTLRQNDFSLSIDRDFDTVIDNCALTPRDNDGTWITEDMRGAYKQLYRSGHAHSFEVWNNEQLVGGLYGIAIGNIFSGESMFHHQTDASKVAFVFACLHLQSLNYSLLDCQIQNNHLASLGVNIISREKFKDYLPTSKSESDIPSDRTITSHIHWVNSEIKNASDLLVAINELT